MYKNIILGLLSLPMAVAAQESLQKLEPVNFAKVSITDPFWKGRMQVVATNTLDACVLYTETKTGRIRNFEKAAAGKGEHEGIYYDDSDVYKALEAMAYSLKNHPDAETEKKADEWIRKIAAAQLPDGYLNTYYQLTDLTKRWTDMEKHEDYCAGHLIEAGIAYHNTTGKRSLLEVAIRFADHIDANFRLANRPWVSGHQEIELALMRLYHHTGARKYLELSQWFLEQRGHGLGKGKIWDEWKDPDYCQDGLPVKEQQEITGHAVRAMYMYTGAADVAAVTRDAGYMKAMHTIWEDVVYRNMYITGGIGAQGKNEGFGKDYDLPNETAYCETCASVGMVFWNQRMNMLSGESRYIDVLERSLYNAALDGLALTGDRFFYGNPLASSGQHQRREWFGTACCPSNIARLVASLGNYIYSTSSNAVWVNLYIGSEIKLPLNKQQVGLSMQTGYPWKGTTTIAITESAKQAYQLRLRIPGWLQAPVPGDLYRFSDGLPTGSVKLLLNGKEIPFTTENGYAVVERKWKKGDLLEINTPLELRKIMSHPDLKQNTGSIALQYGPMVYCVEGVDNGGKALNFIVPKDARFKVQYEAGKLGGINTIQFDANVFDVSADGQQITTTRKTMTAIPYFSWNNRGAGEMLIWLPTTVAQLKITP
ncbi:beta-L-arabinofuranosidase domain-containing protein [Flavihumibacter sp. CACIAM 22H1]|uniref:glycoside hydrolase family 127 protein n=1 Tax=Flavihumibacter sp. CACIAM 22H1 TaxID=1812911 RepID=UPI000A958E18|nr:beta-L-arabinofuranosidase domain-containing protein [Flavihumibacter sp. CACIAM 22H1]